MRLAHYQIEHLREYIDHQSIWYDDVKEEILDHVATAVEERMAAGEESFVDASAVVFTELKIHQFQRQKLKAEHIATLKEVGSEMLLFFTGKRLFFTVLIVLLSGIMLFASSGLIKEFGWLSIMGPILLMIYFIVIPTYARKFRVLYQSYYMSRINAIYLPSSLVSSLFGWVENWLLQQPLVLMTFFILYYLFVIAGIIVMNRTLKKVKTNVA